VGNIPPTSVNHSAKLVDIIQPISGRRFIHWHVEDNPPTHGNHSTKSGKHSTDKWKMCYPLVHGRYSTNTWKPFHKKVESMPPIGGKRFIHWHVEDIPLIHGNHSTR